MTQSTPKDYNMSTLRKQPKNYRHVGERLFKDKYAFLSDAFWNTSFLLLPPPFAGPDDIFFLTLQVCFLPFHFPTPFQWNENVFFYFLDYWLLTKLVLVISSSFYSGRYKLDYTMISTSAQLGCLACHQCRYQLMLVESFGKCLTLLGYEAIS